jgi:hypothetical protein
MMPMLKLFWIFSGCLAATALAQDPVALSPDYKVEIDNQWVRVLRVRHPGRVKIGMHEHPAAFAIFLTDIHEKITMPDGSIRPLERKAGDFGFNEANKHAEENTSDQPLEAVIIELKPGAPKSSPISLDPVKLDPTNHTVLFENDRVRAIRTILPPHVKSPLHEHPHYVVVYMDDMHSKMTLANGKVVNNDRKPGEIAWRDALKHETLQDGETPTAEIQVEIK